MWKCLKYLIGDSQYSINNATQSLDKLKHLHIDQDETMISFDITTLFTSVDLKLAINLIKELLDNAQLPKGPLTTEITCERLQLCLTTYFRFDGELYEQLKGSPMGSPILRLGTEVLMPKIEEIVLP